MDIAAIDWANVARIDSKDGCIPEFYMRAVQHSAKTREAGRPIFEQKPYVRILIPGQRNSLVDRPVRAEDQTRWPDAWRRFEERQEQVVDGMPIEHWPFLTVAQVAELRALNIRTVEQIAALSDAGLDNIGVGARELQKRARQFLQPPTDTERELRHENERLRGEVDALKARFDALSAQLDHEDGAAAADKAKPKARGRAG